jgi:hypothetical protein
VSRLQTHRVVVAGELGEGGLKVGRGKPKDGTRIAEGGGAADESSGVADVFNDVAEDDDVKLLMKIVPEKIAVNDGKAEGAADIINTGFSEINAGDIVAHFSRGGAAFTLTDADFQ